MATSPNVSNYSIPRGVVHFNGVHLGDCTQFQYTANITKLDHFSSMAGIRTKDKSVISELGATIALVLDEINDYNVSLFLLAEGSTATMGGLTNTDLSGSLTFTGTNDVGNQVTFVGSVQLQPGGNFDLIVANDWQKIPLNAEVLLSGGAYGEWTVTGTT